MQILAKMTKKIGGYRRFSDPQDLAMMSTREVNKSPFTEWIVDEPKPKDFIVPSFKQLMESQILWITFSIFNKKWLWRREIQLFFVKYFLQHLLDQFLLQN